MNICFIYKNYPIDGNFDSGIGRYLFELSSELKKRNKIVIITTSKKPRTIKSGNLTIYALTYPNSNRRSISFLKHLFNISLFLPKVINKHKIEIIEFANWESEGLFFTSTLNKILNIPVVVRLHTPSYIDHRYNNRPKYLSERLMEYCEKRFVNQRENHLTTSTFFNANECTKDYNLNKKVEIIPLGIKQKPPNHLLPQASHTNSQISILFVGRLEKRKGIDILIKAIPKVLSGVKNARFIIVGRENNNSDWINELRNSIPYKYLATINFLGYVGNQNIISRLYADADICVFPARYESFGLTVAEAMSFGKAVVASKVGGVPEIITDNVDGILVKSEKPAELSLAIKTLIKDPLLRSRLAKNAFKKVKAKFGVSQMARKTLQFYESLLIGR